MEPLLVLRVHTDLRLGLGHVARALVLQDAWRALGGRACIAVSGGEGARRVGSGRHPFLDEVLPCEAVDLGTELHAALPEALRVPEAVVLVDQWDTSAEQIAALRPLKVAVMEDDGDAHEGADLLFQPFLEGVSWPAGPVKVVDGRKVKPCETRHGACRVLRGGAYAVVGAEATRLRPKREPLQPLVVRKLLVTFGGTDGPGLAQRAFGLLKNLVEEGRWAGTCTVVAPRGVEGAPFPGCSVVPQLPAMTRRLVDYDAVWCAMGLTLAELLCLGIPAVAWGQNERQEGIIGDLALAGACCDLGLGPEADLRVAAGALAHWLGPEGQETRQEQVAAGMGLIDGLAAARLAQELWALARA